MIIKAKVSSKRRSAKRVWSN